MHFESSEEETDLDKSLCCLSRISQLSINSEVDYIEDEDVPEEADATLPAGVTAVTTVEDGAGDCVASLEEAGRMMGDDSEVVQAGGEDGSRKGKIFSIIRESDYSQS